MKKKSEPIEPTLGKQLSFYPWLIPDYEPDFLTDVEPLNRNYELELVSKSKRAYWRSLK